jgi:hypothetical protein
VALRPLSAGIPLANEDRSEAPLHVTVLGAAADPGVKALHAAALRAVASHEPIEVRDPADKRPLATSVVDPKLDRAALFLCTARACSSPVFRDGDVRKRILRAEMRTGQ